MEEQHIRHNRAHTHKTTDHQKSEGVGGTYLGEDARANGMEDTEGHVTPGKHHLATSTQRAQ